jgi:hypothetical protein
VPLRTVEALSRPAIIANKDFFSHCAFSLRAAWPICQFYLPKTFFTSPTFFWIFPLTFSAVPRSRRFGLPDAWPAFSLMVPLASFTLPLILSFVLDFIHRNRLSRPRGMGRAQNPMKRACWILLFACLLSACGRNDGEPVLGFVFQVEGTAESHVRTEPDRSRPLSAGSYFAAGAGIRLLAESSAALCLTPGIYLRCFGPARVEIEDLRVSKDGDETGNSMIMRRAAVRLSDGRFHFFLPRAGSARAELKIETEAGTIIANPGALFFVARKGESIRVLCVRGVVNWENAQAVSTSIVAGYYGERKLAGNAEPAVIAASEDAEAQNEVIAALDSAETLSELETNLRNAPAPWRKH